MTGALGLFCHAKIDEAQLCLSIKRYLHFAEVSASHQPTLRDLDSLVAAGSR